MVGLRLKHLTRQLCPSMFPLTLTILTLTGLIISTNDSGGQGQRPVVNEGKIVDKITSCLVETYSKKLSS